MRFLKISILLFMLACLERNVETRDKIEIGRNKVTLAEEFKGQPVYERKHDKEFREKWLARKRELRDRKSREFEAKRNVELGYADAEYTLKNKKQK